MRLIIFLFISYYSTIILANELCFSEQSDGVFSIGDRVCHFSAIGDCRQELSSISIEQALILTEKTLRYVNGKFRYDSIKENYYHYIATIHTASVYFSYAYGRHNYPWKSEQYYGLWLEWLYRTEHDFFEVTTGFMKRGVKGNNPLFPKDWLFSKYEIALNKAVCGDVKSSQLLGHFKKMKAITLGIPGNEFVKFIADEGDRDQLLTLISFDIVKYWRAIHDEMMDILQKYHSFTGVEFMAIPTQIRNNKFLIPFISQINDQEEKLNEMVKY